MRKATKTTKATAGPQKKAATSAAIRTFSMIQGESATLKGYRERHQAVLTLIPIEEAFRYMDVPKGDHPGNLRLVGEIQAARSRLLSEGKAALAAEVGSPKWIYDHISKSAQFFADVAALRDSGETNDPIIQIVLSNGERLTVDGCRRVCMFDYLHKTDPDGDKWGLIPALVLDPATVDETEADIIVAKLHSAEMRRPWSQYAKALGAQALRKRGLPWAQVALQMQTTETKLQQWIEGLELHQRAERETGIYNESLFSKWQRFRKDALNRDMKVDTTGRIWPWVRDGIMYGYFGAVGDINNNDTFRIIYRTPALKAEIRKGGDWKKVEMAVEHLKSKGKLAAFVRHLDIVLAEARPSTAQLGRFHEEQPTTRLEAATKCSMLAQYLIELVPQLTSDIKVRAA